MTLPAHLEPVQSEAIPTTLGVMLTGGGARAAYQVGLLRGMARHYPDLKFQIITGVSAGAINAMYLAAKQGTLADKARDLDAMWCQLNCDSIYKMDWKTFLPFRAAISSIIPWKKFRRTPHGLMDTTPLRRLMCRVLGVQPGEPVPGIAENIRSGELHALTLMTLDYSTGQSVRWVQGRTHAVYDRPNQRNTATEGFASRVPSRPLSTSALRASSRCRPGTSAFPKRRMSASYPDTRLQRRSSASSSTRSSST